MEATVDVLEAVSDDGFTRIKGLDGQREVRQAYNEICGIITEMDRLAAGSVFEENRTGGEQINILVPSFVRGDVPYYAACTVETERRKGIVLLRITQNSRRQGGLGFQLNYTFTETERISDMFQLDIEFHRDFNDTFRPKTAIKSGKIIWTNNGVRISATDFSNVPEIVSIVSRTLHALREKPAETQKFAERTRKILEAFDPVI